MLLAKAQATIQINLQSGGSAFLTGDAPPSTSHDGGRGLDIDNIPDRFLFRTVPYQGNSVAYVKAPGEDGSIVVRSGNSFRVGSVSEQSDRDNGLSAVELAKSKTAALATQLHNLNLLVYTQPEDVVRNMLNAFTGAGATAAIYNDPRFLGTAINNVTITFFKDHFNHMHFGVPNPIDVGVPLQQSAVQDATQTQVFASSAAAGDPDGVIDLGRLNGNRAVSAALDNTNSEFVYRFEVGDITSGFHEREYFDTPRDLSVTLNGLNADADLELSYDLNEDGILGIDEVLFDSISAGNAAEAIDAMQLQTGVYYVRVLKRAGDTSFNLTLEVTPLAVPPDNAANTTRGSAELGTLASSVNRTDFIGEVDTDDYYRFRLTGVSDVDLSVTGLNTGDVYLTIGRDVTGDDILQFDEMIRFSDVEGDASESLQMVRLPAGEYFLRVSRVSGNSTYQLQASASASTIPTDQAGDTVATAFDLGTLTAAVTRSDFVGSIDHTDLYKFALDAQRGLSLRLSGLIDDADIRIYRDSNNDGIVARNEVLAISQNPGSEDEEIDFAGLAPGEYLVMVDRYEGDTDYSLSLSPKNATGVDLVISRTDPSTAPDLGTQSMYRLTVTNNGPEAATNVVLTDKLPSGLRLIRVEKSLALSTVQTSGSQITGRISSLAPGESASFDVIQNSFVAGQLLTDTMVTSATADFDSSNNRLDDGFRVNAIVSPPADLELSQTVSNINPKIDDQLTITLKLSSKGPGTATVIKVKDILPAGLTFLSYTTDSGTYDSGSGIWSVGNMPPDETVELRILVNVASGLSLTNKAEIVAVDEADPDSTPNNNQAMEDDQTTVVINATADTFDIDGDGQQNPFQDAVLLFAWMSPGTPDSVFQTFIGANAVRKTPAEVKQFLDNKAALFDIDLDGSQNPFQDAVSVFAWMSLGTSDAVLQNFIAENADASRDTAAEVRDYLDGLQNANGTAAAQQTVLTQDDAVFRQPDAADNPSLFKIDEEPVTIFVPEPEEELDTIFSASDQEPSIMERLFGLIIAGHGVLI
ncbi:MAG: hypothetical protein WKF77_18335 [Planctomycetaceae bacterium]